MKITLVDEKGKAVDLSKENKAQPWVFIFQGKNLSPQSYGGCVDKVLTNAQSGIEGMKRRLEFVGVDTANCRFFAAWYDDAARKINVDYNREGKIDSGVEKLADDIIKSRLTSPSGKLYGATRASHEMGGVMFFGHCFGGMVVSSLERALENQLNEKLPLTEDVSKILQESKAVLVNPMLRVSCMPKYFDTFALANCSDYFLHCVPEYAEIKEDLLLYGGFDEKQLFHYNREASGWRYPQGCHMHYMKIKKSHDLRLLVVNSFDMPSEEQVNAQVKRESRNSDDYQRLLDKYAGGHELSGLIKPLNIKTSRFMQQLQSVYLQQTAVQFSKAKEAQEGLNQQLKKIQTACGSKELGL